MGRRHFAGSGGISFRCPVAGKRANLRASTGRCSGSRGGAVQDTFCGLRRNPCQPVEAEFLPLVTLAMFARTLPKMTPVSSSNTAHETVGESRSKGKRQRLSCTDRSKPLDPDAEKPSPLFEYVVCGSSYPCVRVRDKLRALRGPVQNQSCVGDDCSITAVRLDMSPAYLGRCPATAELCTRSGGGAHQRGNQ